MNAARTPRHARGWNDAIIELIRLTSTVLPDDIMSALERAAADPAESFQACGILRTLLENADLACTAPSPICQDTGTLTFWIDAPAGMDPAPLAAGIREAVDESTRRGYLRRNTIETLSGKSIDDNLAPDAPVLHFEPSASGDEVRIWLLLKGGGCENVSSQYSLPDASLPAGRDLDGVRASVLHAVWRAQGLGCAPGILGVCIGSDRAEGYLHAKRQLLRPLTDAAPEPELSALETRLLTEANSLGIGPMGLGGRTTLLGVKLAARSRIPASYFVTIAYSCWACRRRGLVATRDGAVKGWLG
jgi:fumarate hydratase, class I